MVETIEDRDKELDLKDNTIGFLIDQIEISHEQTMKQTKKLNLTELLDKTDRVKNRLDKTFKTHKHIN